MRCFGGQGTKGDTERERETDRQTDTGRQRNWTRYAERHFSENVGNVNGDKKAALAPLKGAVPVDKAHRLQRTHGRNVWTTNSRSGSTHKTVTPPPSLSAYCEDSHLPSYRLLQVPLHRNCNNGAASRERSALSLSTSRRQRAKSEYHRPSPSTA